MIISWDRWSLGVAHCAFCFWFSYTFLFSQVYELEQHGYFSPFTTKPPSFSSCLFRCAFNIAPLELYTFQFRPFPLMHATHSFSVFFTQGKKVPLGQFYSTTVRVPLHICLSLQYFLIYSFSKMCSISVSAIYKCWFSQLYVKWVLYSVLCLLTII